MLIPSWLTHHCLGAGTVLWKIPSLFPPAGSGEPLFLEGGSYNLELQANLLFKWNNLNATCHVTSSIPWMLRTVVFFCYVCRLLSNVQLKFMYTADMCLVPTVCQKLGLWLGIKQTCPYLVRGALGVLEKLLGWIQNTRFSPWFCP